MGTASGGGTRLPTWGRRAANYLFGAKDPNTGFLGDARIGQAGVDFGAILNQLQPSLQAGYSGGSAQRDIASDLTYKGITDTQGIAESSRGALGQQNWLSSLVPGLFGAANDFAGNINQGESAYNTALGGATQSMNNVMNPTLYNPLFQNAMQNQIAPSINAQFSARGLGSGGAPMAAITGAGSGLADQFAQRQFQEQLGAQQNITNIGQGLVQSGVQGAQLPGQVFNQFMQGMGQGQQNYNLSGQTQLQPLQALGAGSEQYWQGVNNPIATGQNMYEFSRTPMSTLLGGVTGVSGGVAGSDYHSLLGIPK